jgi:hypothetical protein
LRDRAKSLQRVGFEADTRSMSRRLTAALLSTVFLAVPAEASAQTSDERAAAQAFADITLPAAHEIAAVQETIVFGDSPACKADGRLARGTERQRDRMFVAIEMQAIAGLTRRIEPILRRTVATLNTVQAADPVLVGGRRAWRSVRRMYSRFAALPHARICSQVRDYVRGGYKPTPWIRRALKLSRVGERWDTSEIDRAMEQAIKRMVALGVSPEHADGFDGDITEENSSASAAQAPAPSSPLASLIAAR